MGEITSFSISQCHFKPLTIHLEANIISWIKLKLRLYVTTRPQNHKSNTNEGKDPANSRIPQMLTSFMFILEDIDLLVSISCCKGVTQFLWQKWRKERPLTLKLGSTTGFLKKKCSSCSLSRTKWSIWFPQLDREYINLPKHRFCPHLDWYIELWYHWTLATYPSLWKGRIHP